MHQDKASCLARARKWLEQPTAEGVRYAALELRMVVELLTYEKLRAASDIAPPEVLNTWQPPLAVKNLLEFDEFADKTFTVEVGALPAETDLGSQEWLLLGEHCALSLKWLRNYHKLGNFLHVSMSASLPGDWLSKSTALLVSVADELAKVLSSSITGFNHRGGYKFNCGDCGKLIIRNAEALREGKTAICSTPGCDAEYRAVGFEDDAPVVEPIEIQFVCENCKKQAFVAQRKVAVGNDISCSHCNARFRIAALQQRWGLSRVG